MSVNTAHANNGVLIHSGECILLFSDNVSMEFFGQSGPLFKGTKVGRIYLTTHRMIFNSKSANDPLQSFSFPFVALSDVEVEQPVFGANYIKGKVRAQENGNWIGEAKFKLLFKSGGAIDFAQSMLRAVHMARKNYHNDAPPPYVPPSGGWYAAPPPAYTPNPTGYYGWQPNTQAFPNHPPANTVFMSDNPPPYPGIFPQSGGLAGGFQPNAGNQFAGYQPNPVYPQAGGYPGMQPTGYPQGGPPGYQPTNYPQMNPNGYPQTGPVGYPNAPSAPSGYPSSGMMGIGGGSGYPPQGGMPGAMGFSAPPPPNTKEAEATQSAYYDPNQPQTAFVPPPAYYEQPPSYNSATKKQQ